jgi:hypothetical protein
MRSIKAIDTRYNGHLFRSRLEARWAVFLDAVHCPFWYESDRFDLGTSTYLPDFRIIDEYPDSSWWLEIKPTDPLGWERQLCYELAKKTGEVVRMFVGPPECGKFHVLMWDRFSSVPKATAVNKPADFGWLFFKTGNQDRWKNNPHFIGAALEDASSARFEYGQRPAAVVDFAELRELKRRHEARCSIEDAWAPVMREISCYKSEHGIATELAVRLEIERQRAESLRILQPPEQVIHIVLPPELACTRPATTGIVFRDNSGSRTVSHEELLAYVLEHEEDLPPVSDADDTVIE